MVRHRLFNAYISFDRQILNRSFFRIFKIYICRLISDGAISEILKIKKALTTVAILSKISLLQEFLKIKVN